jgi:RNA polymerase sigma-70 factor (ECF subfamily)
MATALLSRERPDSYDSESAPAPRSEHNLVWGQKDDETISVFKRLPGSAKYRSCRKRFVDFHPHPLNATKSHRSRHFQRLFKRRHCHLGVKWRPTRGWAIGERQPVGSTSADVTMLLSRLAEGDKSVVPQLMPLVYDELRRLAASYMRRERPDHTLQPTALVHEAYLRLVEQRATSWKNRAHFFGVAAQLMRRILVDHARGRLRNKRGGEGQKVSLDEAFVFSPDQSAEIVDVDEALSRLEKLDPRQCRVVELRFFGGLTVDEAAEALHISPRTVEREWQFARAWLYMELKQPHGTDAGQVG